MKIAFIAPANSVHTVRWVNTLSEKKHQIMLVSLPNHRAKKNTINSNVQIKYLPISGGPGYYLNAISLKKLINTFQPGVTNAHSASGYGTLVRVAKISDIVLSVWGSDVYDFPYHNFINMKILKKNLNYATHIVSTSTAMGKQVERILQGKKGMDIVPFGVDIQKFKLQAYDTFKSGFTFCVVKSLESLYGIDIILKAFNLFLNKINNKETIELHIYGEGSQKNHLVQLSTELGCNDKVKWKGFIKNDSLSEILPTMDVFCVGSRRESFGVSTIEAMAAGLPVIATKTDGASEIIVNNETGFLVSQESVEGMCECMISLYYDEELRKKLGTAARKRVEGLYDWDKNVNTAISIYQKIEEGI